MGTKPKLHPSSPPLPNLAPRRTVRPGHPFSTWGGSGTWGYQA